MARNKTEKQGSLDRFAGRLYNRTISIVPFCFGLAAIFGAKSGFTDGPIWFGILALLFSSGCFWLVKYLWSPQRKLSEIDD